MTTISSLDSQQWTGSDEARRVQDSLNNLQQIWLRSGQYYKDVPQQK